jgi:integrase
MAVTMARPWKDKKTGKLHLRQRTPSDMGRLRGTFVSLPLGCQIKTVKIGEMVQMSLHTRDTSEAKRLHAVADAALRRFWEAHRTGREIASNDTLGPAVSPLSEQYPATSAPRPMPDGDPLTMDALLESWLAYHADKKAKNTLKRYKASLRSLAAYTGDRDVRSLTDDDLHAWAEHRRDKEGVSPRAINKNDLVAASSMFKWAMDRSGGRVMTANPAKGVHLDEPKVQVTRERTFRPEEIRAILRASLKVAPHPRDLSISNAARWCPWLAAYSGARIGELCNLRGIDIWAEEGILVMHLWRTKGGIPRKVPIHTHLLEQGFLEFVRSCGARPLFYDEARHRKGALTDPAEIRAQQLAIWVREAAGLTDRDVDPQHGWRHSFKTIALGAGIEERIRDAITGHKVASVGRKYEAPSVPMLAKALAKFPRYQVSRADGDDDGVPYENVCSSRSQVEAIKKKTRC